MTAISNNGNYISVINNRTTDFNKDDIRFKITQGNFIISDPTKSIIIPYSEVSSPASSSLADLRNQVNAFCT